MATAHKLSWINPWLAASILACLPSMSVGGQATLNTQTPQSSTVRDEHTARQMHQAWQTLRLVYCERCHGRSFDGMVAPSIVDYVRATNREQFIRIVMDGQVDRGMPGYNDNPLVKRDIDIIYRYFVGRADGSIPVKPIKPK